MTERSSIAWRRSSRCANNTCVEVALLDDQIMVRDAKNPRGPVLRFTPTEWSAFLDGARNGEFDRSVDRPG
jgi:Domain of unknown function (DUF397)